LRAALREQHEREMDDLHARHEKERDELSDRIENDRLNRQKQRAREDREYAEKQEAAKQAFIEAENKRQIIETRKKEDEARERKRAQDYAAIYQKQLDEAKRAYLAEQLDEEEYQRRVQQIQDERDKKIQATGVTLEEQQRMIADQLDREVRDLNEQLDEKITTIKERYIDRMEDLLRDGGEAMRPIIDNIGEQMESAFAGARNQVNEVITVLTAALKNVQDLSAAIKAIPPVPAAPSPSQPGGGGGGGGGGKCDWYGIYNSCRGNGGKDADCRGKADRECPPERRQTGGPVRAGRSYMVGEAGPELFVPSVNGRIYPNGAHMPGDCPSCPSSPATVTASESFMRGLTGNGNTQTINNNYTVNAAYGRTQPEGSVRMDLAALVALTSR
jgi:hypothetical protein